MTSSMHDLDPGVPGLAGFAIAAHILVALQNKGILTLPEIQQILKNSVQQLGKPEQRAAATQMIKVVINNSGL